MRLFAALDLPEAVADRLEPLQAGVPGARWVARRNLHLTLRFFGEVEDPVAHDLDDALAHAFARPGGPPALLWLSGVAWFGDERKPRQLVVSAKPDPGLMHLQAKVDRAGVAAGLAPDTRRFVPHVTLARFAGRPGDRLFGWHAQHNLINIGPIGIDRFVLYRSFLKPDGPVYQPLADYPLVDEAEADVDASVTP